MSSPAWTEIVTAVGTSIAAIAAVAAACIAKAAAETWRDTLTNQTVDGSISAVRELRSAFDRVVVLTRDKTPAKVVWEALLIVPIEQLVPNLVRRLLIGQFKGFRPKPLCADDVDQAIGDAKKPLQLDLGQKDQLRAAAPKYTQTRKKSFSSMRYWQNRKLRLTSTNRASCPNSRRSLPCVSQRRVSDAVAAATRVPR
jgi:hypothetical protein